MKDNEFFACVWLKALHAENSGIYVNVTILLYQAIK